MHIKLNHPSVRLNIQKVSLQLFGYIFNEADGRLSRQNWITVHWIADMVLLKGPINIKSLFSLLNVKYGGRLIFKGFYSRIKGAFNEICFLNNLEINILWSTLHTFPCCIWPIMSHDLFLKVTRKNVSSLVSPKGQQKLF